MSAEVHVARLSIPAPKALRKGFLERQEQHMPAQVNASRKVRRKWFVGCGQCSAPLIGMNVHPSWQLVDMAARLCIPQICLKERAKGRCAINVAKAICVWVPILD